MGQSASLDDLAAFVRVVELGSFTAAARDLGLPRSTLSRRIATLERGRGQTLLERTTRRVRVTTDGQLLFEQAAGAVAQLRVSLRNPREEPVTPLRVSAPPFLRGLLLEALGSRTHALHLVPPQASNDLSLSLVPPSTRGVQRVQEVGRLVPVLVAAQDYLARAGVPRSLDDLDQHRVVVVSEQSSAPYRWPVFVAGRARLVPVEPGAVVPDRHLVRRAVGLGLGLGRVWQQEVGALTPVLPGLEGPPEPVWALASGRRGQEQRLARCIEWVRDALDGGTDL